MPAQPISLSAGPIGDFGKVSIPAIPHSLARVVFRDAGYVEKPCAQALTERPGLIYFGSSPTVPAAV